MPVSNTGAVIAPMLPCLSLGETLRFYRALEFEVTHEQTEPYVYGVVQWGPVHLHFHDQHRRLDPAKNTAACLVSVPEVRQIHRAFVDGLKRTYGRVPTAGIPRITRLREGQHRFGLFDPAGNTLIFAAWSEPEPEYYTEQEAPGSRLAEALDTAVWLRDLRGFDDVAAARVLDKALARATEKDEAFSPVDLARVLAARAELAVALGEVERLPGLRERLQRVPITEEERVRYLDELQAADELERMLKG